MEACSDWEMIPMEGDLIVVPRVLPKGQSPFRKC